MGQICSLRAILCLSRVLSYFQDKSSSFDRREDFRSNFKEEQMSYKAHKNQRKKDKGSEDCAPRGTTMLNWPGPHTSRHTADGRPQYYADKRFLELFNTVSFPIFGTSWLCFLERQLRFSVLYKRHRGRLDQVSFSYKLQKISDLQWKE